MLPREAWFLARSRSSIKASGVSGGTKKGTGSAAHLEAHLGCREWVRGT